MSVERREYLKEGPIRSGRWQDFDGRVWSMRGDIVDKKRLSRLLRPGAPIAMFWGGELWLSAVEPAGGLPVEIADIVNDFGEESVVFAEFRSGSCRLVVVEIRC